MKLHICFHLIEKMCHNKNDNITLTLLVSELSTLGQFVKLVFSY